MICNKCRLETKDVYNSKWISLEIRIGGFRRYDLCPPCGQKVKDWLETEPEQVNLELVRRPR